MKKQLIFCALFSLALNAAAQQTDCTSVGAHLNELASADQQVRQEWNLLEQDAKTSAAQRDALQQRWRTVDSENLKQYKKIIAACGWPKTSKDSHSAWLLAQHADSDIAFQRLAKGLLEASVKAGIAAPRDLAYLADRIAANEGRPQEYGTQFSQTDRCHLVLELVDDQQLVNRRRMAIGLQSLEEYEAEGRRRFIPPDCANTAIERETQ
jgi:DNA helicase IV